MLIAVLVTVIESCDSKREPGKIYMPDMAYSRAYEAYAPNNLKERRILIISLIPLKEQSEEVILFPYTLPNDSNGYKMSAEVKDPLPPLDTIQMAEAQRLFNINCAICHGAKNGCQAAGNRRKDSCSGKSYIGTICENA